MSRYVAAPRALIDDRSEHMHLRDREAFDVYSPTGSSSVDTGLVTPSGLKIYRQETVNPVGFGHHYTD